MKSIKEMKKKNSIKNKDGSSIFLLIFTALFLGMVVRAFMISDGAQVGPNGEIIRPEKPIEMSFSDVLRRSEDIDTMSIRGNEAQGTLKDGSAR